MKTTEPGKVSLRETLRLHERAYRILNKQCPRLFLSSFLYAVVHGVLPYVGIWFSAQIINELAQGRSAERLWQLVFLTITTTAAMGIANAVLERWRAACRDAFGYQKKKIFVNKLFDLDYSALDEQWVRDLLSQVEQNETWTGWGFWKLALFYFDEMTAAVIRILSALVLTVSLFTRQVPEAAGKLAVLNHPLMGAAVAGMLLVTTFLAPVCANRANSYWTNWANQTKQGNRSFTFFGYMIKQRERALDMRMYNQQDICTDYFRQNNTLGCDSYIARAGVGPMGLFAGLAAAISTSFTGVVYLFVCLKAWAGAFGVGSVTQYISSVTALAGGTTQLLATLGDMRNNAPFLQTTFAFLDVPNEMYQGSLTTEKRTDRSYEVEFQDVSFRYPGSKNWALRHVSMKFRVGQRLAVVGQNGSGKTTFIKLLCRLYDPTEGQILLNGIDIRKYRYDDYMSIFSVVFQDFKLLCLPLGQNVAAGSQYDEEKVTDCLNKAGFAEKLKRMPQGTETVLYQDLDENGEAVSGGEAQKIAIARALYKDAPFIILDEPTAALDPVAEAEIYTKFNEIVEDRTAIYISHRLSSCRFCDDIAVFDGGRIVQQGSHGSLVAQKEGKYHELWYAQAQYYAAES